MNRFSLLVSILLLSLSLGLTPTLYAEPVDLTFTTDKGGVIVERVDSDIRYLMLSDYDNSDKSVHITGVSDLSVLPNLERLEVFLAGKLVDFSFIGRLVNLKFLTIDNAGNSDLHFLESLAKLEKLHLGFSYRARPADPPVTEPIDFSKLKNLTFFNYGANPTWRPLNFINVQNRPLIVLDNCQIMTLRPNDVETLRQFGAISLMYTPISANVKELEKLKGMRVFTSGELPAELSSLYHGFE